MVKVYFYTVEHGPTKIPYYQDLIVNLATGFKQLGIEYYASNDYWQISPEDDDFLIVSTPHISHNDCDLVVLERQWYEKNGCLPQDLFVKSRQYTTVYLDCSDGVRTMSWLPEFRQFDFIFKTHYSNNIKYPSNFHPWAFGLSQRVLHEFQNDISWAEKRHDILVNFRHKNSGHSVRNYIQKTFIPQIREIIKINTDSEDLTSVPKDPYHYLRWKQTGRRHYPNYYRRLQRSRACACFGGFFLAPGWTDYHVRSTYYLSRLIGELGWKTNRISQWDSWRFWESMAAGCTTFHLDFDKYGFRLPVMPQNWQHYIGIDLDNISGAIERIANNPAILQQVADAGKTWAINNYGCKATATRFLQTVANFEYSPEIS